MKNRIILTAMGLLAASGALAQAGKGAPSEKGWEFGAVLDTTATSRPLAMGSRDKGLQLGHSDLTAHGPPGAHLAGGVVARVAPQGGKLEKGFGEVWLEPPSLPAGLQLRAGRFPSQVGYLNTQHPHADDFTDRPLLYRAFFGGHWNDEGLRLSWTAPTSLYWTVGVEAFRGRKLVTETANTPGHIGAITWATKLGGDLNRSHSWQLGLSHINNRREAAVEDEAEHAEEGHDHSHSAQLSGRKTWMIDATWKWAPNGNNRDQQVRLGFEAARITGLNRFASGRDRHEANALSAVWRFHPSWEVGARSDWLRGRMPHGEHFHNLLLREHSLMVAWKPSHQQTLRLQWTGQRDAVGVDAPARRSLQLQYILAFGAHGAHAF